MDDGFAEAVLFNLAFTARDNHQQQLEAAVSFIVLFNLALTARDNHQQQLEAAVSIIQWLSSNRTP